ncbi:MAG: hypothetical protein JNN22_10720 [Rhodospirillales bacterium]|nr:hypothetical protein [Rhodospirillales bacterium]
MLSLALPLLRAVLASPMPAPAHGGADAPAPSNAPAPVLPSFALVAAGYGFGPLRAPPQRPRPVNDRRRDRGNRRQ